MSAAFVLARFTDSEKRLPAISQLDNCAPVKRWDAVDGHFHLVLRVEGSASALPDAVRKLIGLQTVAAYDIIGNDNCGPDAPPDGTRAYIFVDAEPALKDGLLKTVREFPETVCAASVKGGCDVVAVIQGESIQSLERTINEKIRPLNGVLRLKHNHIIDLKQL